MCIAIYKPLGNQVPCEEHLRASFERNDDGAGFAFNTDDHQVMIVKGLMTWESFITTFREYEKKYGFKDRGLLIHFRITTHGGTNPECTHPFPVIADEGAMHKLVYKTRYAAIHNGIISLTSTEAYRRDKMSDTMVFIEKYLTKIASNKGWFDNKSNFELIYDLIESKMAVLRGDGQINATAGFEQDADGNYYSNLSYKEPRYKSLTSKSSYKNSGYYGGYYGGWDEWEDYGYGGDYADYRGYGADYEYPTEKDGYAYSTTDSEGFPVRKRRMNLMMLKPDEVFINEISEYDFISEDVPMLMNADGDVFISSTKPDSYGRVNYYDLELIDTDAYALSSAYREIPFRKDCYTFETLYQFGEVE